MREDFLHFVWRNKQFNFSDLVSEHNQKIVIVRFGDYVQTSGPDFFNAQLYIDTQLWAGNVEMHLKASDWYAHSHETDENYDNVILHVVWEYDIDVFRKDGSVIPVLNLSKYIDEKLVKKYFSLRNSVNWLYCENQLNEIDTFTWFQWKESLLIDRLEIKAKPIEKLLMETHNNWEEVLFFLLTKNFGLNVNGSVFEQTAKNISYKVVLKERFNSFNLEALFFGISGLLHIPKEDVYYKELLKEFNYLAEKHRLEKLVSEPIHFFKLRPDNFPTIRFSQLADLFHKKEHLFSDLIQQENSLDSLYNYFSVSVSEYWQTHFVFDKESKASPKKLSRSFIDLLLLNTILPLRFVYLKSLGNFEYDDIFDVYRNIPAEKNAVVDKFKALKLQIENAFDSQALIHLKKNFCEQKKCLQCAIGVKLLRNNV
nr:DUF2851 family protein [uncultured Flavobacterium sp.]